MSEWKTVRLGDVCEILDSKRVPITAHERKNGSYPYYGANGIQDYVADYIFDDELVLLAEDGGNFGSKEKPIAYRVSGKCWVNNHAHVCTSRYTATIQSCRTCLQGFKHFKAVQAAWDFTEPVLLRTGLRA